MQITTPRLVIRPVSLEYVESTHEYAGDLDNTRYMMFLPRENIEETERYIRESMEEMAKDAPEYFEFVILRDGAQVGGISMFFLERRDEAELGWILNKRYWGNGYALEAVRATMDWARREWGVRRFIAQCDAENEASWRLMEKLGMRRIACSGGRKNRASNEARQELTYEIVYRE